MTAKTKSEKYQARNYAERFATPSKISGTRFRWKQNCPQRCNEHNIKTLTIKRTSHLNVFPFGRMYYRLPLFIDRLSAEIAVNVNSGWPITNQAIRDIHAVRASRAFF